ncbi:tyrosine-type recombinase/integrase [Streptomyces sp. NPDC051677]|uniref:tyrosine-type recombinase/integrase n=1 Tax=Streptomyces sp. NPDC051677 TaxID=3365669 RepID=UPI0037CFA8DE
MTGLRGLQPESGLGYKSLTNLRPAGTENRPPPWRSGLLCCLRATCGPPQAATPPTRTSENYRSHVTDWLDRCRETGPAWDRVAAQHIALWAHRSGVPHSATARRVSAVRSFYAYALRSDAVVYNPAARRPRLTNPAQLTPAGLGSWQIAVLLAAFDERGRHVSTHPHQDRACGYLQLGLALRSGLLLAVNLDDLSTERDIGIGADTLRLPNPAGGHRLVALPPLVGDAVNAYLSRRRPPRDSTHGGPLFTSRTGIRMPHRYPHDLLRAVARSSGLLSPPV